MTHSAPKWVKAGGLGALMSALVAAGLAGCERAASPSPEPVSPAAKGSSLTAGAPEPAERALSGIVQLTGGFDRAGEAYFSADTNWIVFQAAPKGQQHYDMYVARLKKQGDRITGLRKTKAAV